MSRVPQLIPMALSRLLLAALVSPLAAQTTWIVDPNGAGDFSDLPPALAAANDGDTILVRPGSYHLTMSHK